jgi:hypothetical protein
MGVHSKLMEARLRLQAAELKKTGHNKFAGYNYFELGDFLPTAQQIFADLGLCGVVSFTADIATLTITDTDESPDAPSIVITSPMGSAALKGCHEVQNVGAVETYQRRYLWVSAFEIVEHDALDATTGKGAAQRGNPTDGAWEALDDETRGFLLKVAAEVIARVANDPLDGVEYLEAQQLTSEEKIGLWTRLDSKVRAALKKAQQQGKQ